MCVRSSRKLQSVRTEGRERGGRGRDRRKGRKEEREGRKERERGREGEGERERDIVSITRHYGHLEEK